jgi:AcrR family transcriptional regulator
MSAKQPKEVRVGSLLDAAIEEFLEKGYEGASVDAIAKRAGVSKGGLYHHFRNKEELMLGVNKKLSEPVYEMIGKACSNPSAIEGMRQYIRDYLSYWASRPKELGFFFLSTSKAFESVMLMDYYREYMNEYTALITGLYKRAADSGEMRIEDPEAYGLALIGTMDGVLSYVITGSQADIAALAERIGKVLLRQGG